ncbi:hypothetical protein K435DRAFT_808279 [Dendrothele bispora CBS 962.96]|uniref:Uncharacterized protein n=1 Tax=Dendrothele bispora (strain CBS 962.96) TaxID=1314807 RepID=A0A4S8L1Z1_DENBC|nr:hypothetical protein K435DRAFT_808279 [Dendrothele bispora CBS 962.96]
MVLEVRSPTDLGFSGPLSFSRPECRRCLEDASMPFDIGIVGFPFDTRFLSPYDNSKALDQMEAAYDMLLSRTVPVYSGADGEERYREHTKQFALDRKKTRGSSRPVGIIQFPPHFPISEQNLRSHFDARLPMVTTAQESSDHGSFFAVAAEEGLLTNTGVHAGIRCKMMGFDDIRHDSTVKFQVIATDDIDDYGEKKVVEKMR